MLNLFKNFWSEETGQGMTEYGLILGFISIAIIAILIVMRDNLKGIFEKISTGLSDANQ